MQDVTEREQLLLQLEAVLDGINEAVIIADLEGNIVRINKMAIAMLEYGNGQLPRSVAEFRSMFQVLDTEGDPVPPDQWPLARALRGEKFTDCEIMLRRKGADNAFFRSINGGPVYNQSGDVILAVTTSRDVTEKKRMEDALRVAKAQLELVTENMSIGVTKCTPDQRYEWVSRAYAAWLGKVPSDIVGRPIVEVIGAEAYRTILPDIQQVLGGERVEKHSKVRIAGLGFRCIDFRYVPTYDAAGQADGWVEVLWDTTEMNELQEELRRSKDLLAEELRSKEQMLVHQGKMAVMGEMIGFIAHQWRQPLNTLGLMVQELPVYFTTGAITEDYLKTMVSKARGIIADMSRTIDDFRTFFRPEKVKVRFDVKTQLEKALGLVKDALKEKHAELQMHPGVKLEAEGYPNEFSQVILNIVINTLDAFSERAVAQPTIVVKTYKENGRGVVTISDNAGGIAEDIIEKIFDAYFTTKDEAKGTGLGLYMAKIIIEKHMGGSITVKNVPGGAEFRITL